MYTKNSENIVTIQGYRTILETQNLRQGLDKF